MRHLTDLRIDAAAAAALIAVAACVHVVATAASPGRAVPSGWIAAEGAARRRGIARFEVVGEDRGRLDVRLDGPSGGGRLRVRAGADEVEQALDGAGDRWVVRTRRDALVLGHGGAERAIARSAPGLAGRAGSVAWTGAPLEPAEAAALGTIVALDGSLAVQGSSLVFGGRAYVSCTARCDAAEACVRRSPREIAGCAGDVVVCAACLERAP